MPHDDLVDLQDGVQAKDVIPGVLSLDFHLPHVSLTMTGKAGTKSELRASLASVEGPSQGVFAGIQSQHGRGRIVGAAPTVRTGWREIVVVVATGL
jgi:hypothetical protein